MQEVQESRERFASKAEQHIKALGGGEGYELMVTAGEGLLVSLS
jgi:hypothetical protein